MVVLNKASKVENIEGRIEEIEPNGTGVYIYGYSEPKLLASIAYGKLAYLAESNYFILYFTKDKVILFVLNLLGDFTEEYVTIPYKDIESFKVKSGIIQYVLKIKIKNEPKTLKIKCNKFILNMPWQKENLNQLNALNWNQLV